MNKHKNSVEKTMYCRKVENHEWHESRNPRKQNYSSHDSMREWQQ